MTSVAIRADTPSSPIGRRQQRCCVGFFFFVGMAVFLATLAMTVSFSFFNEAYVMCMNMAFMMVNDEVREVDGCARLTVNDNSLVHYRCPLSHSGATDVGTGFHTPGHKISVHSRILQWQERIHTRAPATPGQYAPSSRYCYCFELVWSDTIIPLNKEHINPYQLCGSTQDSFSSSTSDCSREGMYPTSIHANYGPWLRSIGGNTSTTGLGVFESYSPDMRTRSDDGLIVDPKYLASLELPPTARPYVTNASGRTPMVPP